MPKIRRKIAVPVAIALLVPTIAFLGTELRARYVGYQFRTSTDEAARTAAVRKLLTLGDPGTSRLVDTLRHGPAEARSAILSVVSQLTPTDPNVTRLAVHSVERFASTDSAGKVALLDLVPVLVKGEDAAAEAGRALVAGGLVDESVEVICAAISHAARPEVGQTESAKAWLDHPAVDVRRAAVLALSPIRSGPLVVAVETLFPRLNDGDEDVRALTVAGLKARGLSAAEIALGKKLGSPAAADRLALLFDLRWASRAVKDPGPWLQRLAGDPEPAVRAGAARVAVELGLAATIGWVDALADRDPDESVRRVAGFYRGRYRDVRPAGYPD